MNVDNPQNDINVLKPYMTGDDIILFPIANYSFVSTIPNEIPGIELGTGGTTSSTILSAMHLIPPEIKYITYDYERGYSPDWTSDFKTSMNYFKELKTLSNESGKLFMPFPVFMLGADWNWGEVASNSDVLVVQVMNWQTNATKTPSEITPKSLDVTLEELTNFLVDQIDRHSPETKLFYQFGFYQTNNTDSVLYDIIRAKEYGIDGVVIVYNTELTSATSNLHLAEELLQKYRNQLESNPLCPNCDDDNDSISNFLDNCKSQPNVTQIDSDNDGFGDVCDIDIDGDGIVFLGDNCSNTYNPDQLITISEIFGDACIDLDYDGINIPHDNCPDVSNPDQLNLDGDSVGDACDLDMDQDGILNSSDNCPINSNSGQMDLDGDGLGNLCDDDLDGDNLLNTNDNCPTISNPIQDDYDFDNIGDVCDIDADQDGILNSSDNCPLFANSDQLNLDGDSVGDACDLDMDQDGILNSSDNCIDVSNPNQNDSTFNNIGDACETPKSSMVNPPYFRKTFSPIQINKNIVGDLEQLDGFRVSNIVAPSCEYGTCISTNSFNLGVKSSVTKQSFIREFITYDLANSGISGSKINNMTLHIGGCWHGNNARLCNDGSNPGFSNTGTFLVAIWDGTTWKPFNNHLAITNSSDIYKHYKINKISGFVNENIQNDKVRIILQTGGMIKQNHEVNHVVDHAYLEITFQN